MRLAANVLANRKPGSRSKIRKRRRYTRSSWNVLRKGQASHSLPGP